MNKLPSIVTIAAALHLTVHATIWTDQDIASAIDHRINWDFDVTGNGLKVIVKNGIVTLDGTVTNLMEKHRAEQIAASRRGVRAVINKVIIDAGPISDNNITKSVVDALLDDPIFDNQEINIETVNGIVSMSGHVGSHDLKWLSEQAVAPVIGVRGIENELSIKLSEAKRTDKEIEAHIDRRYRADVWLNDLHITVGSMNGNVSLAGKVGTLEQLNRAVQKAWVPGAVSVDSVQLTVDPLIQDTSRRTFAMPTLNDLEIVDAIKDALSMHSWIVSSDIDVTVKNGVATLKGSVNSLRVKTAARRTAQNTIGVERVNDFITLGAAPPIPDTILVDRALRNLKRNVYLSRYPITVEASNGTVKLSGTVETPFERNQAEMVVSSTYGVQGVENNIETNRLPRGYDPIPLDELADRQPHHNKVANLAKKPDAEIKESVESEIFWSWWVDSDSVNVDVKDGTVILSGTVASERERRAAVANAFDGGAHEVVNELTVK